MEFSLLYLLPSLYTERVGLYGAGVTTSPVDREFYEAQRKLGDQGIRAAMETLRQFDHGLDESKAIMRPMAFTGASARTSPKATGIIEEGMRGGFDVLVLGKRGRTWLDNVFEGTEDVGRHMLASWCSRPVWLCPSVSPDRSNVLLCLDGCAQRHQITRHVGDMLLKAPRHSVTLFNVERESGVRECDYHLENMIDESTQMLVEMGIDRKRIQARHVISNNVAGAILDEVESGRYAAVGLGHPIREDGLDRLFGSVSSVLYRKLNSAALWIHA